MAQIRNSGSHGLQQLIDSYNDEIMRYSRLAAPETEELRQKAEKDFAEREREEGEFEAERGRTEQAYWLGEGKYGAIRNGAEGEAAGHETPTGGAFGGEPDAGGEPQAAWLAELEQGLLELKRGLAELAKGQRELLEGQRDHMKGIMEREYWLNQNGKAQGSAERDPWLNQNGKAQESAERDPWHNQNSQAQESTERDPWHNQNGQMQQSGNNNYAWQDSIPVLSPVGAVPANQPDTPPAQSADSIPSDGSGFGWLQAAVYTARRAVPIPGALVTVFSGGAPYASYVTDIDGKTPVIQLPAGTASAPDESYAAPFVNYRVIVTADGYYPKNDITAQIFSGETALLPVEMVPLPDGA